MRNNGFRDDVSNSSKRTTGVLSLRYSSTSHGMSWSTDSGCEVLDWKRSTKAPTVLTSYPVKWTVFRSARQRAEHSKIRKYMPRDIFLDRWTTPTRGMSLPRLVSAHGGGMAYYLCKKLGQLSLNFDYVFSEFEECLTQRRMLKLSLVSGDWGQNIKLLFPTDKRGHARYILNGSW